MTHPPFAARAIAARLAAATLIGVAGQAAVAQPPAGQPPARFENLKVYSKDIPRDSLLGIMRGFTAALGVNCAYCHVSEPAPPGGPPGAPRERLKAAADDKQAKLTARFMIRMADSLNQVVLTALPKRHAPAIAVGCVTCHHGSPLPQTVDAVLAETIARSGADSAVAQYRQLRGEMASGRYDFRETPVTELAQRLVTGGHAPDAIKLLMAGQEFFPNSPGVDMGLGEAYLASGDKPQAIARFRAVLTKRPNDMRARQRLQELGVQVEAAPPAPGRPGLR